MAKLEEVFDEKGGTFAKGWSDRRIGEELNLPIAAVTKVRRDAFGELKATTELDSIRGELKACFDKLVMIEGRLNKLEVAQ